MGVLVRTYSSRRKTSVVEILRDSFNGFRESWFLAYQFAKRDIKAQYRQSLLGFFWALAPVVMSTSIWIFLKQSGTISLSSSQIPYPLYVVIGTTMWSILTDCLLMTITTVNSNKSILTKINFQKEALITLGALKLSVNVGIKLLLIAVLMAYYQSAIGWSVIWFFPVLLVFVVSFIGMGILIAPIGLLYADIGRVIPVFMQVLMFLSPVVYVAPESGFLHEFMQWNPLAYFLDTVRQLLTGGPIANGSLIVVYAIISFALLLLALVIYRIAMPVITERMSA